MEFDEIYPKRVTRFEDGSYRWSYDVNLKTDPTLWHILLLIPAGCAVVFILTERIANRGRPIPLSGLPVLLGVLALVTALIWVVYRIFRAALHDRYTLGYAMDEKAIVMVYTPGMQRYMRAVGAVGQAIRAPAQYVSSQPDAIPLRKIRSLREYPERNMISIRSGITFLQIWVPGEDYAWLTAYLREHRNSARPKREQNP